MESKESSDKGGHPRFYQIIESLSDLHNRKNTDYAKGMNEGPLGNFHRTATIQALYPNMDWATPFGVAMAYMLKQLDAAMVLKSTKRDSVTGEPITDRMKDVAVYAILLMILDEESREANIPVADQSIYPGIVSLRPHKDIAVWNCDCAACEDCRRTNPGAGPVRPPYPF